jgi:hypothetical protein
MPTIAVVVAGQAQVEAAVLRERSADPPASLKRPVSCPLIRIAPSEGANASQNGCLARSIRAGQREPLAWVELGLEPRDHVVGASNAWIERAG